MFNDKEGADAGASADGGAVAKTKKAGKKAVAKKAVAKKAVAKKAVAKKAPAKQAAPAAKQAVAKKAPKAGNGRPGIGDYARSLLAKEPDVDKVLAQVLAKFPDANTSRNSIYWYRSQMNRA